MNHSRLHDPKYVGPGIWFSIHTLSANAKTPKEKENVIKQIRILQENFPCQECKTHFGKYLLNHPPEETIRDTNEDSLFLWTVNFHNSVNYRLGKPQISYEEAKSIFMNASIFCMKASCDEEEKKSPEKSNVKLVPSGSSSLYYRMHRK
jgi:hypothetical protein